MKIINVRVKSTSVKQERFAYESFDVEDYWVGIGFCGRKNDLQPRRFLRCRSKNGFIRYFFWTKPRRGEQLPRVRNFRKRIKLTRLQVERHFVVKEKLEL
jgi:hypothetical protein